MTTFDFYTAKGGQGCSTVAASLALTLTGRVLLVDLSDQQDLDAVLGLPNTPHEEFVAVTDRVDLWRTTTGFVPDSPDHEYDHVVVDWGRRTDRPVDGAILVTHAAYPALRAATAHKNRPDRIVLVQHREAALRAADVATVLTRPIVATVDVDPAIARAVDAGLLSARVPTTVGRKLTDLAATEAVTV